MERRVTDALQPVEGFVYNELSENNRAYLGHVTDCSICLSDYRMGNLTVTTGCAHHYHYGCLMRALTRRNDCPLCRTQLVPAAVNPAAWREHLARLLVEFGERAPLLLYGEEVAEQRGRRRGGRGGGRAAGMMDEEFPAPNPNNPVQQQAAPLQAEAGRPNGQHPPVVQVPIANLVPVSGKATKCELLKVFTLQCRLYLTRRRLCRPTGTHGVY